MINDLYYKDSIKFDTGYEIISQDIRSYMDIYAIFLRIRKSDGFDVNYFELASIKLKSNLPTQIYFPILFTTASDGNIINYGNGYMTIDGKIYIRANSKIDGFAEVIIYSTFISV